MTNELITNTINEYTNIYGKLSIKNQGTIRIEDQQEELKEKRNGEERVTKRQKGVEDEQ